MDQGAVVVEIPTRNKMAELRMTCLMEIRIRQRRAELAAASFRESIGSTKSAAEENLENGDKLSKLKDSLRELDADLCNSLAVKSRKEAKCRAITEAISTTVARTEEFKMKIQDQRARKDEYAALISQQLLTLEGLEEKSHEDVIQTRNIEEAIMWYKRVLGFRTEGGEGVKYVFTNIHLKNPDEEYTFTIRLVGNRYELMNCIPYVEDINGLIKELNKTNDLFKFVRTMRQKFQAVALNGTVPTTSSFIQDSASIVISSPPPVSVDSRNATPTKDSVHHSQPKKARLKSNTKLIPGQLTTPSPRSISNLRRSPRFVNVNEQS